MTKNEIIEIIEMARQAGARQMISSLTHPNGPVTALKFDLDNGSIEAFTKLVAEKAIKEALAQPDQGEPVSLMIYRGELCYKSQEDDQSFGMWCPVTKDLPFPEGTKLYTTPPQPKEPKQDPVAWMVWGENNVPSLTFKKPSDKYVFDSLYTTPPHRPWVRLTDEEHMILYTKANSGLHDWARAIEAKLKDKNTGEKE